MKQVPISYGPKTLNSRLINWPQHYIIQYKYIVVVSCDRYWLKTHGREILRTKRLPNLVFCPGTFCHVPKVIRNINLLLKLIHQIFSVWWQACFNYETKETLYFGGLYYSRGKYSNQQVFYFLGLHDCLLEIWTLLCWIIHILESAVLSQGS